MFWSLSEGRGMCWCPGNVRTIPVPKAHYAEQKTRTVSTGNPGDNTYDKFIMGDCDDAATFKAISYDEPTRLETTDKSCLQPITGPIVIEGYTGVGMDVVGAGCEDRRKYQWWTLGEQPYDNVWHTSGGI